jgi:two-component system KDP operon response regulator KdpE
LPEAARALVVEDEADIRRFVRLALEREGLVVADAGTVERGLVEAGLHRPDLVVLDLGLPDGDGLGFLREFRGWSSAPVLVLSARSGESEKVRALDAGADDYLVKPFGSAELLARVRAHLRRRRQERGDEGASLAFGDLVLDRAHRKVTRAGEPVHLTPIEYRLLQLLTARPDRVLTHRQLMLALWGPHQAEDAHALRVHMANLRKKIEADPSRPRWLRTETGVGYRFASDAPEGPAAL